MFRYLSGVFSQINKLSTITRWCFAVQICILPSLLSAQGLFNNNAKIVIRDNAHIYIGGATGHYRSVFGGAFVNSNSDGLVTLTGNWLNQSGNTAFSNPGATVRLAGASQNLGGNSSLAFYNLEAVGAGIKTLSVNTEVSNLLTLGNNVIFNSENKLILSTTATSNANVAAIPASSHISGNVYVQVYFTGNNNHAYRGTRAFSSPVTEAVSTTYSQLKNYMVITGKNGGNFDPGGLTSPFATTLTRYNESATLSQAQFTPVSSINESLLPGHATFLFFRGSRNSYSPSTAGISAKVNVPFMAPENVVMNYFGPLNQQSITVNVPYTDNGEITHDGYNLIGNPFPAVISWDLLTKNNMEEELKFVKPNGGFAVLKGSTIVNANDFSGNLLYIMPGQGFYVRSKPGGGSITFTESAKSNQATPLRLMSSLNQSSLLTSSFDTPFSNVLKSSPKNELRINLQNAANTEEIVAIFKDGGIAKANNDDAAFFGGSSVILSSLSEDNIKLTINSMPEIGDVEELKLSVGAAETGPVKLNFTDLSAVLNQEVILEDHYLNTKTDVKANPSYSFFIDKALSASYGDSRFKLVFKSYNSIKDFQARKALKGVELLWEAPSVITISKFIIERSEDDLIYNAIAHVPYTIADRTYSVFDTDPIKGSNYYRLKQIDFNGKETIYKPAFIEYSFEEGTNFALFPNPAVDWITIRLPKQKSSTILFIYDLQGKEISKQTVTKDELIKENISALTPGIYIIKLKEQTNSQTIWAAKFLKL